MAERRTRLLVTGEGPVLVSGPVELVGPDGTVTRSDRPVTALCTCRRSRRFPLCDTSHRDRIRRSGARARDDSGPDPAPRPEPTPTPCDDDEHH